MATEQELKQAAYIYKTVCDYLDEKNYKYEKRDEIFGVDLTMVGEDIPIPISIRLNKELMVLSVYSGIPFLVPEEMRVPMVVAVTAATNRMVDGGFDYDVNSGKIFFRITSTYRGSIIGKKLIEYMIDCTFDMADEFNDKFYIMVRDNMNASQMLDMIYKGV